MAEAFDAHHLEGERRPRSCRPDDSGWPRSRPALDEWLAWPARAPLVVFDHEGADDLTRAFAGSDLFVGPTDRSINSIDPFPVVTAGPPPKACPPWRDVDARTDPADIVQAASEGTPLRWLSGPGRYSELADIVAEDSTRSSDKQSVIGHNGQFSLRRRSWRRPPRERQRPRPGRPEGPTSPSTLVMVRPVAAVDLVMARRVLVPAPSKPAADPQGGRDWSVLINPCISYN
ncbi:hypothetical protein BH23ACT5_BH23ACT5_01850 [soil metagenome]